MPLTHDFVRQALGSMLLGIFTYSTSIVYQVEKLPFWLQITIHAGLGLVCYFIVAFNLGWLSFFNYGQVLLFVLLFAAIWTGVYLYKKHEAKKINQKLAEMQAKRQG